MPDTIRIDGLDELRALLGDTVTLEKLEPAMHQVVAYLWRQMAAYPQQRAGTTYRRTGTLGRRWITRVKNKYSKLEGQVGNNTSYGPWVQSDRFQADTHRGIWQTDRQVLEDSERLIQEIFEERIASLLAGDE